MEVAGHKVDYFLFWNPGASKGFPRDFEGAGIAAGVQGIEQQAWVVVAFWLRSCFSELLLPTAAL